MYETQIQRGIEWLEEEHPGKDLNTVRLDDLKLDDWDKCILGQLLGGVDCKSMIWSEPIWAKDHGFSLSMFATDDDWELLTLEWARILRARRAARNSESKVGQ